MHEIDGKKKLWNSVYIYMLFTNAFCAFSFYMVMTILSKYIIGVGFSLAVSGAVVGTFSVTSLIIRPFTGFVSDRMNQKRLLILSNSLCVIALLGYVCTANIVVIFAARILHGIGFGINSTVVISAAIQTIPDDKAGEGIGYLGLGQVFASAIAPGIGISIMEAFGIRYTFFAAAGVAFLGLICVLFYNYRPRKQEKGQWTFSLQDFFCPSVLHFAGVSGVYSLINGVISAYLLLFSEERGIANVSIYFTACALTLFVVRLVAGKLMDKKGLNFVLYPAVVLTLLSLVVLSLSTSLTGILISGVLRSIGQGTAQPALQTASIQKAGKEKAGVATSTYYLGGDIGQGIGPMIGGVIASAFGYGNLFLICGGILVVAILLYKLYITKEMISGREIKNVEERI